MFVCTCMCIVPLQEKAWDFSSLRFDCSIGVSSSANTVFYSLTPVLCTAVTSTSALPHTQTNAAFIFSVLILFL